jgi:iron(III) transport system permease protein
MLLSIASISSVNPSLEEAARLSCGWTWVLRYISLPLAGPGILLSLILTFLLAFGELSAPSFLRLEMFPMESFTQFSAFYNAGRATAAAIPFAIAAPLLVIATQKWTSAGEYHFRWTHVACSPISLGGFESWITVAFLAFATVLVVLPCAAIVNLGLSMNAIASAWENAGDSLSWSLCYGAVTATAITVLGFFLGYASQRRTFPAVRELSLIPLMLFALPGTLIGIGLVIAWNRPSLGWLYSGPATLMTGLTLQYAAIGERGVASIMAQISSSMEEAAEVAGATWSQQIRTILLPLMKPSLLIIWVLSFIMCLRDTSLPLLLSPPGKDPLTARTLTLMANGSPEMIAALCLFSMALPLVPAVITFVAYRAGGRS